MSSSSTASVTYIGQQVTIYLGIVIISSGIIGNLLIILVLFSLKTFRQNSCAFYLAIMSIANIGQMITGLLARVMISGFAIDWSLTSSFYCKFRFCFFQICALISMTCICLATIDQYLATSFRRQWQQWSNIQLTHRLSAMFTLIWLLHNVVYLVYADHVVSTSTGKITCVITNSIFQRYNTYGVVLVLGKILPVCITFFFGILAYYNVRRLAFRTVPLVRRELDKQLTIMVITQVAFGLISIVPYVTVSILLLIPNVTRDPTIAAHLQFASTLTICLFYMYFAVSVDE